MPGKTTAVDGYPESARYKTARVGRCQIELLPCAPYHVSYEPGQPVIGFSFDRQCGIHAFASDRISGFQALPNSLAFVPAGCDVFSESNAGGEYLKINCPDSFVSPHSRHRRFSNRIDRAAIQAAHHLRRVMLSGEPASQLDCDALMMVFQVSVEKALGDADRCDQTGAWLTATRMAQIDELIEAGMDTPLTVSGIAASFGLSAGYFSREFKKAVGQSPYQYIVDKRLARARQLICQTRQDLSSIALACGFTSHSHMTGQFRVRLGVTPGRLRG